MAVLRIGTRGSPLALAQAHLVRAKLMAAHALAEEHFEIRIIKTSGDMIQDRPLSEVGGKGLFTKEIEEALQANEIDLAVHSMKDVATRLPDGLVITAILEREDPRDAFISLKYGAIKDLPKGTVVGTSSLRRQAQLLHQRPDLKVVPFRGNVQTRLKKLADGVADATFLAVAGLNRLGMTDRITAPIEVADMLPAAAQGAIGVEIRVSDEKMATLLAPLDHQPSHIAVICERSFLARLDGSCRTPIAGHATLDGSGALSFAGEILSPDGKLTARTSRSGQAKDAAQAGDDAASEILAKGDPRLFVGRS